MKFYEPKAHTRHTLGSYDTFYLIFIINIYKLFKLICDDRFGIYFMQNKIFKLVYHTTRFACIIYIYIYIINYYKIKCNNLILHNPTMIVTNSICKLFIVKLVLLAHRKHRSNMNIRVRYELERTGTFCT